MLLEPIKHYCIALIFRPQQEGLKQISFDFRPELGFVLEWVGWENSVSFCGSNITDHSATNKIVVRQFFETTNENGKVCRQNFDLFYYILPGGNIVMGNMDFDPMSAKMRSFNI